MALLAIGAIGGAAGVAGAAGSTSTMSSTAANYGYAATPSTTAGGATLTLSTASPTLSASGGDLSYQLTVAPGTSATSAQARLTVKSASGTTVFLKTRYLNGLQSGGAHTQVLDFERTFTGSLKPGVYTVTCAVTVAGPLSREVAEFTEYLTVYDAAAGAVPYVPVLRISAPPMRGTDGSFELDPDGPAMADRASGAIALANWILADDTHVATLAIAPLLLEEWADAANGYNLTPVADRVEPVHVGASDPPALRYASALDLLGQATATGRLTVSFTGYADPDLSAMAALATTGDLAAHYGLSAKLGGGKGAYGSLGPSLTLSAPLVTGSCTNAVVETLAAAGVSRIVLPDWAIRASDSDSLAAGDAIASGTLVDNMQVLVTDAVLSNALAGSREATAPAMASAVLAPLASLAQSDIVAGGAPRARAVQVAIGENPAATQAVLAKLTMLADQPWVVLTSAGQASTDSVPLQLSAQPDTASPWGTADAVDNILAARVRASTYAALAFESKTAPRALRLALAAQCGADPGPLDTFSTTDRRAALASAAGTMADAVLSKVRVRVASVTLPSVEGALPITIVNGSDEVLSGTLRITASGGAALTADDKTSGQYRGRSAVSGTYTSRELALTLPPNETFIEQGVALRNESAGTVTVELLAADETSSQTYAVSAESVTVKASYLETAATIGLVVLIGIALVAYVYSRARRAAGPSHQEDQWTE